MTAAERANLSRPFDPTVWKKAGQIARSYKLVIEQEPDLGYVGCTVELPLVMADGRTIEACAREVIEATALAVAALLETGERPPSAAREGKRDQQLNIRVSGEEKLRLEAAARAGGYRSVSDFLRERGLERSR